MKAAVRTQYGPPEKLKIQEVDKPIPRTNEVLIRVHSATVSRTDSGILRGKPFVLRFFTGLFKPKLSITGSDFAGEVVEVGRGVKTFSTGDRVWGFDDQGLASHAEFMTVQESSAILKVPEGISYEQAAASAEGAHYAFNFINKVQLEKDDHVLVNGATGAIGSAAVQFLKQLGANVTAVCGTANLERIKSLGANRVIDYENEDFTRDQQKYKFVFDAVGKSTFGNCKPIMEAGGIYISSELGPGAQNLFLALFTPLFSKKKVKFPFPSDIRKSLLFTQDLLEKGEFKPLIDRSFPLEHIVEAYKYVETGQKVGNVILSMNSD